MLLAEWFERENEAIEEALGHRLARTGESLDEALEAGLRVGSVFAKWRRGYRGDV